MAMKFCDMCVECGFDCEYSWRCEYFLHAPKTNGIRRGGAELMARDQRRYLNEFDTKWKNHRDLVNKMMARQARILAATASRG